MMKIPKTYDEAKKWIRPIFIIMIILPIVLIFFAINMRKNSLPELFKAPSFDLINQNEKQFSSKTLAGKYWAVNFFFTKCTSVCPMQISKLKNFKDKYPDIELEFISITVDPQYDNPKRLKEYIQEMSIIEERWNFLTGEESDIRNVIVNGFKSGMDEVENDGLFDIAHANYLLLIDKENYVRAIVRFDEKNFEQKLISLYQNIFN
ncbi:hypothetical protein CL659_00820 [bacterium]|nr:hypothetical protein [bacterium]